MKKLKYFEARKDKLLYRRRVPVGLRSLYGKDFYYRQLNCSVGAADAEVIKAWTEAHESFEAMVTSKFLTALCDSDHGWRDRK